MSKKKVKKITVADVEKLIKEVPAEVCGTLIIGIFRGKLVCIKHAYKLWDGFTVLWIFGEQTWLTGLDVFARKYIGEKLKEYYVDRE